MKVITVETINEARQVNLSEAEDLLAQIKRRVKIMELCGLGFIYKVQQSCPIDSFDSGAGHGLMVMMDQLEEVFGQLETVLGFRNN